MIIKAANGFYVYSKANKTGRRKRIGGPYIKFSTAKAREARYLKKKRSK